MNAGRTPITGLTAVLVGSAAGFGMVVSSGVVAVVVAGWLQWVHLPRWLDNTIPLLVLAAGLLFAGRVVADVAGRAAYRSAVLVAGLVGLIGMALSRAGEAHGDGIEAGQVLVATVVVLIAVLGSVTWTLRRRQGAYGD